jgi:hypothetical protein
MAARHAATDLRYTGCSEDREVVWFAAESASTPGKLNTVAWDTVGRTAHCDCTAAEIGKHTCWHADLVEAAYLAELARQFVARLDDAALADAGRMARERVAAAATFWFAATPLDPAILAAARAEYRRRRAAVAAPVIALPVVAVVAVAA